jgi:hypothetical protein
MLIKRFYCTDKAALLTFPNRNRFRAVRIQVKQPAVIQDQKSSQREVLFGISVELELGEMPFPT